MTCAGWKGRRARVFHKVGAMDVWNVRRGWLLRSERRQSPGETGQQQERKDGCLSAVDVGDVLWYRGL